MLLSLLLEGITKYYICGGEVLTLECHVTVYALHVFADIDNEAKYDYFFYMRSIDKPDLVS